MNNPFRENEITRHAQAVEEEASRVAEDNAARIRTLRRKMFDKADSLDTKSLVDLLQSAVSAPQDNVTDTVIETLLDVLECRLPSEKYVAVCQDIESKI